VLTVLGAAAGSAEADVEASVARLASELDIAVGKPMPALQKYVRAKWRSFDEVRERVHYRQIAVEAQGKMLYHFNMGRESKVSLDSLRTLQVVTPDLRALLAYLGHYGAAIAGTGEEHTKWYLSWPGRGKPMVIQNARTLQGRLDFAAQRRPGSDARFSTKRMTLEAAKAEFAAGRAHTREQHIAANGAARYSRGVGGVPGEQRRRVALPGRRVPDKVGQLQRERADLSRVGVFRLCPAQVDRRRGFGQPRARARGGGELNFYPFLRFGPGRGIGVGNKLSMCPWN
jgi:hypothetical protein